jgi:hypothetical protein
MIVRSIRLKNIKSYGEGPDGRGVTVYFEPGTNRITGKEWARQVDADRESWVCAVP